MNNSSELDSVSPLAVPLHGAHGQGKVALVDIEGYELVKDIKWFFDRGYAYHIFWKAKKPVKVYMHRLVFPVGSGVVDHINGDGLDNRRVNLRQATRAQNVINTNKISAKSGYRGVYWHAGKSKWGVRIGYGGKELSFGYYSDKHVAANVRLLKERELYGDFAQ